MTAFEDTTPFVLALLITFTALVCISIWNNYSSVKVEKEVLKPKNDGPSRTRELLIRFTKFYNDLDAHDNFLYDTLSLYHRILKTISVDVYNNQVNKLIFLCPNLLIDPIF